MKLTKEQVSTKYKNLIARGPQFIAAFALLSQLTTHYLKEKDIHLISENIQPHPPPHI